MPDNNQIEEFIKEEKEKKAELLPIFEEISSVRDEVYKEMGDLDPNVIGLPINPNAHPWPYHYRGWRIIQRENSTIFASEGLAAPSLYTGNPLGHNVEILVEVPGEHGPLDGDNFSWPFYIMLCMCNTVNMYKHFQTYLNNAGGYPTNSQPPGPIPRLFHMVLDANYGASVAFLLGVHSKDFPSSFKCNHGTVDLITAKLLHPSELTYTFHEDKDIACKRLIELVNIFGEQPQPHLCDLDRAPVK